MNYLTAQIKAMISDSTVATVAGFTASEWLNHVFITYDLQQFTHSINMGRLPIVAIQEQSANYESTGTSHNEIGGTVSCSWTIRVMTNAFGNRREANYQFLQRVKSAILKKITQDYRTEIVSVEVGNSVVSDTSTYIDFTISADHTYDDKYSEE